MDDDDIIAPTRAAFEWWSALLPTLVYPVSRYQCPAGAIHRFAILLMQVHSQLVDFECSRLAGREAERRRMQACWFGFRLGSLVGWVSQVVEGDE